MIVHEYQMVEFLKHKFCENVMNEHETIQFISTLNRHAVLYCVPNCDKDYSRKAKGDTTEVA